MKNTDTSTAFASKEKASQVPDTEVQREILAQLYLLNENQAKANKEIKTHLTFYTILGWIYFLLMLWGGWYWYNFNN